MMLKGGKDCKVADRVSMHLVYLCLLLSLKTTIQHTSRTLRLATVILESLYCVHNLLFKCTITNLSYKR